MQLEANPAIVNKRRRAKRAEASRNYGHHHPDYMRGAAQAITSKQSKNVSLVVSLVEPKNDRTKRQKSQ
jgi:hypothetical protein